MTKNELIWLAGFTDGEGCFFIQPPAKSGKCPTVHIPRIHWSGTHKPAMYRVADLCQTKARLKKSKAGYRPLWEVAIRGKTAIMMAIELYPYLVVKKDECRIFIAFPYVYKTGGPTRKTPPAIIQIREEIRLELQRLKRKVY